MSGTQLTVVALPVQIFAHHRQLVLGGPAGPGVLRPAAHRRALRRRDRRLDGPAQAGDADLHRARRHLGSAGRASGLAPALRRACCTCSRRCRRCSPGSTARRDRRSSRGSSRLRTCRPQARSSYASTTLATTVGPLVAGLLIAGPGLGVTYGVDTFSFVAAFISIFRLPALPPEGGGTQGVDRQRPRGAALPAPPARRDDDVRRRHRRHDLRDAAGAVPRAGRRTASAAARAPSATSTPRSPPAASSAPSSAAGSAGSDARGWRCWSRSPSGAWRSSASGSSTR